MIGQALADGGIPATVYSSYTYDALNRLGIPQDRIAKRLGLIRTSLHHHLSKMPVLANSTNADLSRGFTVSHVAEKHNWTEPMVWSQALEDKDDLERFKEIGWI